MAVTFGGQSTECQCPVCEFAITWSVFAVSAAGRIRRAAAGHRSGCPATYVDPVWLRQHSREQIIAALQSQAGR